MNFWTYSPEDVQVLIGGFHSIKDFSDGTFITVSKDVQPYTSTRSADGMVGRKWTNNSTFTITLNVMSASPTNDLLTKLWLLDEFTQTAKFPLMIKDSLGSGRFFSTTTWIEQVPDLSYSTDISVRTWVLRSNQGLVHIGGNDRTGELENMANLALSGLPQVQQILNNFI